MPHVKNKCLGESPELIEQQREERERFSVQAVFERARNVGMKKKNAKRAKYFDHVRLFRSSLLF